MNKRDFLKKTAALGAISALDLSFVDRAIAGKSHLSAQQIAQDEDFWKAIRREYRLKADYINLENGYYCIMPQPTEQAYIDHLRDINYQGSWYMRTVQWDNKKSMASKLAKLAGCDVDELIITRNTTESLDLVIHGQNWEAGDEAVMAEQDYGAMLNQFKLMESRFGIKRKLISLPSHPQSDEEIVDLYRSAITKKTRLLMVCHMVNITGQILPIRKIADMAHELGVEVMVDGAHAFGHFQYNISDLKCDYYGTSLHKWLSVPLGAGFLYVKKGKAGNIWPLFAEDEREPDDISRLNHTGTIPVHTDLAIANAISYYEKLGGERKEARLRYLQKYWTEKVRDIDRVIVNTPADGDRHCAIGNVGVEGIAPRELSKIMLDKYRIWTVAINRPGVAGLRITPNVYTTTEELDRFVSALKELAGA